MVDESVQVQKLGQAKLSLRLLSGERNEEECTISKQITYPLATSKTYIPSATNTRPTVAASTQTTLSGESPGNRFNIPQAKKESQSFVPV